MRVFLDANILFSAARADGAVRKLLALLEAAGHQLCADPYVATEASRNLAAKSPAGLPVLAAILARIQMGALVASDAHLPETLTLSEKDRPVLAAAIHCQCKLLVTGDRTHFGALYGKTIQGVRILSPAMVAQSVLFGWDV